MKVSRIVGVSPYNIGDIVMTRHSKVTRSIFHNEVYDLLECNGDIVDIEVHPILYEKIPKVSKPFVSDTRESLVQCFYGGTDFSLDFLSGNIPTTEIHNTRYGNTYENGIGVFNQNIDNYNGGTTTTGTVTIDIGSYNLHQKSQLETRACMVMPEAPDGHTDGYINWMNGAEIVFSLTIATNNGTLSVTYNAGDLTGVIVGVNDVRTNPILIDCDSDGLVTLTDDSGTQHPLNVNIFDVDHLELDITVSLIGDTASEHASYVTLEYPSIDPVRLPDIDNNSTISPYKIVADLT